MLVRRSSVTCILAAGGVVERHRTAVVPGLPRFTHAGRHAAFRHGVRDTWAPRSGVDGLNRGTVAQLGGNRLGGFGHAWANLGYQSLYAALRGGHSDVHRRHGTALMILDRGGDRTQPDHGLLVVDRETAGANLGELAKELPGGRNRPGGERLELA